MIIPKYSVHWADYPHLLRLHPDSEAMLQRKRKMAPLPYWRKNPEQKNRTNWLPGVT